MRMCLLGLGPMVPLPNDDTAILFEVKTALHDKKKDWPDVQWVVWTSICDASIILMLLSSAKHEPQQSTKKH